MILVKLDFMALGWRLDFVQNGGDNMIYILYIYYIYIITLIVVCMWHGAWMALGWRLDLSKMREII